MKTKRSPNAELPVMVSSLPALISSMAPPMPNNSPIALPGPIFSRSMNSAMMVMSSGVLIMISAACIGKVRLRPIKNSIWLSATPKKPPRMSTGQSLRCILLRNLLPPIKLSQNKKVTMPTRIRMNPRGWMSRGITILAIVKPAP